MKFIWTDGYIREIEPGASICGISHVGARPIAVELSSHDFAMILKREDAKQYLTKVMTAVNKSEDCSSCANYGGTRRECQNATCSYEKLTAELLEVK